MYEAGVLLQHFVTHLMLDNCAVETDSDSRDMVLVDACVLWHLLMKGVEHAF